MSKFLLQASYTSEGTRGLLKEGASRRRAIVEEMVKAVGGKLEAFYYAFGDTDVIAIVDIPNNASAAAVSLTVNSVGAVKVKTTVLLTPEEMDHAMTKHVPYKPPGQ